VIGVYYWKSWKLFINKNNSSNVFLYRKKHILLGLPHTYITKEIEEPVIEIKKMLLN